MNMDHLCGWVDRPDEVARIVAQLPIPQIKMAGLPLDKNKEVLLWTFSREVLNGADVDKGPQKIGDCTSWGWGGGCDYLQCAQIWLELHSKGLLLKDLKGSSLDPQSSTDRAAVLGTFQATLTESIYGLSRVEIGGQRGSRDDGSVGAWCADAVTKYGTLSRPYMESLKPGSGAYDPNRAKQWGANGLPSDLETATRQHPVKVTSLVTTAMDAVTCIQNGQPVMVCSNRGFTMTRDSDGFCRPSGTWNHCMKFVGQRWGNRPGLCCAQSWGPNTPDGPTALNQPDNTFWVDMDVADKMLTQQDSFTASQFAEYINQDFIDWRH